MPVDIYEGCTPVDIQDIKTLDRIRHPVIATRPKLDDAVRKDVLNALRQIEGAKTLLRMLLAR